MSRLRTDLKRGLAVANGGRPAEGATLLTYHRVGGPGRDELDVSVVDFEKQMGVLASTSRVVTLDGALDRLDRRDRRATFVLTFDDGFRDLYEHAWPLLRDYRLPFTVYVASAYIGGVMRWPGSTAQDTAAPGLRWDHLEEMVASGLCTVGNHTYSHVRPERLDVNELDRCTELVRERLGVVPRHFAYPWGIAVESMEPLLRDRFRSCATGRVGRNSPRGDRARLRRVPVRRTDPIQFFQAKLVGSLLPERTYRVIVRSAKKAGAHA